MQIVIDISDEQYEIIKKIVKNQNSVCLDTDSAEKIILNGTPLPKGHGRLIDAEPIYDKLIRSYRADERDYPNRGKDYRVGLSNAIDLLSDAPTIIEADKSLTTCHTKAKGGKLD